MRESPPAPLIGVSACVRQIEDHPFHATGDKYVAAVATGAGGTPVLIPSLGPDLESTALLDRLDGLMLTGSPSNVEPQNYAGAPSKQGTKHDPRRDATTLPLIRDAIEQGIPLLAICRGIQELNVALGGTLHQQIQDLPGKLDHRSRKDVTVDLRYAPSHPVSFTPGGFLEGLLGCRDIEVNSLHSQGIDRLGGGVAMEAVAPDGIVEAIRVVDASAFAIGIQWHPEWRCTENAVSRAIFAAFGDACRVRATQRDYPVVSEKVA